MTNQQFEFIQQQFESMNKNMENQFQTLQLQINLLETKIDKTEVRLDKKIDNFQEENRRGFDSLQRELDDIKYEFRSERQKLQEVYESRDRVTVSFTRAWASASFFIALTASTIVLAVAKAF